MAQRTNEGIMKYEQHRQASRDERRGRQLHHVHALRQQGSNRIHRRTEVAGTVDARPFWTIRNLIISGRINSINVAKDNTAGGMTGIAMPI
jgi:hypothetical protein